MANTHAMRNTLDYGQEITNRITVRFLIISFVVGALIGTTGDFVHVITATDAYPENGPFPFLPLIPVHMPVWVPLLFGTAVLLMALTHKALANSYSPRLEANRDFALASPLLFAVLYALTGFIQAGAGALQDAWIAAVAVLLWFFADRTWKGAALAALIAAIGTGFEIFLVKVNGFYYLPEHSNLMGVPSWLPWLYVAASICISMFVRWIK